LLGDVFLHLYPHAIDPHTHNEHDNHSHDHDHDHAHSHEASLFVGLCVLSGFFFFFLIEKLVLIGSGGHGHSHGTTITDVSSPAVKSTPAKSKEGGKLPFSNLEPSALLPVLADFIHNFTDGLAIAASFLVSPSTGLTTSVAVLIHEIPHEIGDLAILVQSGATKAQVIFIQFFTAIGCLAGTIVGLALAADQSNEQTKVKTAILSATAGGFVYIATVGVIPKLLEATSLGQTLKESFAIVAGIGVMVFIAVVLE